MNQALFQENKQESNIEFLPWIEIDCQPKIEPSSWLMSWAGFIFIHARGEDSYKDHVHPHNPGTKCLTLYMS